VRPDRPREHRPSLLHVQLPEGYAPLHEGIATPHVVHQNVELPLLTANAREEPRDLLLDSVIDAHGDALSALRRHQCGRFIDSLGPLLTTGQLAAHAPPSAVDRGAGLAKHHGDATPDTAGGARHHGDSSLQRLRGSLPALFGFHRVTDCVTR